MFDRFVSGARPSSRRRAVLVASLSLHGVVAVGLVVASFFHVAEIAPPPLAIVFLSAPEPPPPPQAPPHKKAAEPHRVATPSPHPQPTIAPPTAPEPSEPGDEGPGAPHGVPGGDPKSPPSDGPPGPAAPAPRPRNIAPHALDAQRLAGAMPHLPAAVQSQRRGLGDTNFVARICVDQHGAVSTVSVLQGIAGADESIMQTLRGWRYKPQPIPVCFISQFVFSVE